MQKAIRLALATAILLGMAATASAQSVMKQCGEQWQAAKAAGTTSGETWPQFLAQCRAHAQFWSCYSRSYACSHHPASNWFLVPVANAGRSGSGGLTGR